MPSTNRIDQLESVVAAELVEEQAHAKLIQRMIDQKELPLAAGLVMSRWSRDNIASLHRIKREINVISGGASMIRTLANTFALTPKTQRKMRELSVDHARLAATDAE